MLSEVERVLVEALHAEDPPARLRGLVEGAGGRLAADERAWLLAAVADDDGLRMAGLLVVKLRFDRVLRGDPSLRRAFEEDAAAFVERFRRYCRDVPPAYVFPQDEARAFAAWSAGVTAAGGGGSRPRDPPRR